jgi:hypothetical protein
MTTTFEIKRATRQGVIPLIGLYSESGCGKTYSALLIARGFVGPTGKILMIDTESRRGSLYADVLPGGYDVLDLDAPFTPARYIEAIQVAEQSGAQIIVVDSMSHEWEGISGVCDMAGDNEAKSGRPGLHNWKTPKMEHAKMVQYLLRSKVPVVCCIRAKYKTRQKKDEKGKTVIIKDEVTSPIQAEDFIYELTAHAEILPNHSIIVTKASHPTLRECLPADKERPITIEDGQKLAAWCASAGGKAPAAQPAASGAPTVKELKAKLWKMLLPHRGTANTWDVAEGWLLAKGCISDGQTISAMTPNQLADVIAAAEGHLND